MKINTILYLQKLLHNEKRNIHIEFCNSCDLAFNPVNRKLNVKQNEYSKLNDILDKGYIQRAEEINKMIEELNQLLPN